jgi:sortase A
MRGLSDKTIRRMIWVLLALAIYFLGSAFYIPAKAMLAQYLLQSAWQDSLVAQTANKPWPWADTHPVARLRVPQHNVDQVVLSGEQGNSLAFAPGMHTASDPADQQGLVVISAHRDTHFRFLQYVIPGDVIELETINSQTIRYRVTETQVVNIKYASLHVPANHRWLGLVTCYPFHTVNAQPALRYLVLAEEVRECPNVQQGCFI